MWKVLAGIVLATAVVGGSVILYPMRNRLFRPDVQHVGGTRVVLTVEGDADAVADALRRRFDPKESEGIVIRVEAGRVEVDVPNGRRHGENVERVRRLSHRPGRLRTGVLAHDQDDADAVAAGKKWLADGANRKALEDAHAKGDPLPPFPGDFKAKGPAAPSARYGWVSLDWERTSHGMSGTPSVAARGHFPLVHELPGVGGRSGVVITLMRQLPAGEGVTNGDVVRPRVQELGRGRFGTYVHVRLAGDGRLRLLDLMGKTAASPGPNPRRIAFAIDDAVLHYFDAPGSLIIDGFQAVVDSATEGEDVIDLIRVPLPAGARVSVDREVILPGR
ncbi:MAG: hypothetical protein ACRC33_23150 [Gemmataceae bacterium]